MTDFLGVCAVHPGTERRAQRDIERAGFGTRVPSYRVSSWRHGRRVVQLRPLFPGYVFPALGRGWGELTAIDGVTVLTNAGEPLRICGRDEERLAELERHCMLGDFNRAQYRTTGEARRRKRKPRRSKRLYRAIT